jgi:hypothetical protein
MSQPSVVITEQDGAIGTLPPGAGGLLAVAGASSLGTADVPAIYARVSDLVAARGVGPGVEAAALYIDRYSRPVLFCPTGTTTAGAMGTIDDESVVGTAKDFITATPAIEPLDDYEAKILIVTGGTTGIAGITYRYSLDGGRTYSPIQSLGTGLIIAIPNSGVSFSITTAKTLVASDYWTARTTAPAANSTEIGTAIDALVASTNVWDMCLVAGLMDGTLFDALAAKAAAVAAAGKERWFFAHMRMPAVGESESTYKTAMDAIFSTRSSVHIALGSGAVKVISSVSGRKYKRPSAFVSAAREASLSEEVNAARIDLGPFAGVSIRDDNGNADEHDESLNPGLDDSRYYVLRTWQGRQGVYVNRPRIFSAEGSDFRLVPHRRVMNLGKRTIRSYLELRVNREIRVDRTTGRILESEALEIDTAANAQLAAALLTKPKASDAVFRLSRTDNILSTNTLTGELRITPLGYPETITVTIGFSNPALQVQAV